MTFFIHEIMDNKHRHLSADVHWIFSDNHSINVVRISLTLFALLCIIYIEKRNLMERQRRKTKEEVDALNRSGEAFSKYIDLFS